MATSAKATPKRERYGVEARKTCVKLSSIVQIVDRVMLRRFDKSQHETRQLANNTGTSAGADSVPILALFVTKLRSTFLDKGFHPFF